MADLNAGTKVCTNCEQNINLASFLMHEVFCFKNVVKCDLCKKPYDKNIKEEHFEEFHAKVACECGEMVEKMFLVSHKLEICKRRQAQCFYCELSLDFDKLPQHMEFCGSRTERCNKCNRYIQAKDQAQHDIQNCSYPEIKAKKTDMPAKTNGRNSASGIRNATHSFNFKRENSDASKSFSLLPCEFCYEYFATEILNDHQVSCMQNPNARHINFSNDFDSFDQRFSTNSSEKIPCEFCKKLLNFDDIILHQSGCEANITPRETPTTRFRSNLQPKPVVRPVAPLQTKSTSTASFSDYKLNNITQPQIKAEPSRYKVVRPKNISNNDESNREELLGSGPSTSKSKISNINERNSSLSKSSSNTGITKMLKANQLPEPVVKRMSPSSDQHTLPRAPISRESRLNAPKKTSPSTIRPTHRSNSTSLKDATGASKGLKK